MPAQGVVTDGIVVPVIHPVKTKPASVLHLLEFGKKFSTQMPIHLVVLMLVILAKSVQIIFIGKIENGVFQ